MSSVCNFTCPGCGARVSLEQKTCKYCHQPVVFTSCTDFCNSIDTNLFTKYAAEYRNIIQEDSENTDANMSLGICYFSMKLYEDALKCFDAAIKKGINNSEAFFYSALCLLQGKRPFLHIRKTIDQVVAYINSANMIEEKGIHFYFLAYIKYDYFYRKYLRIMPDYRETLLYANNLGIKESDIDLVFGLLALEKPQL